MRPSLEEKSVWIQLFGMLGVLGTYFVIAGSMLSDGVYEMRAYVVLFSVAVVLMVVVFVVGHIVTTVTHLPERTDERDRLIGWRAESNSGWIVGIGALSAVTGLVFSIDNILVAHVLLLSLFLSEVVKYALQLVYYRRGM